MEEMEEAEGMSAERETGDSDELQSRIQELKGRLKESESKRMDLIHHNTALHNKLKAVKEEKVYLEEEKTSLKEKLLSMVCSQVKLDVWSVQCISYVRTNMHALLQVEQSLVPQTSPSTPPHQSVAKPDVESKVEELAAQVQQAEDEMVELKKENSALQEKLDAQVQQAEDEKVELEKENSALQKKLIQEVEKYNYHMAVVTQVCTLVYRLRVSGVFCFHPH